MRDSVYNLPGWTEVTINDEQNLNLTNLTILGATSIPLEIVTQLNRRQGGNFSYNVQMQALKPFDVPGLSGTIRPYLRTGDLEKSMRDKNGIEIGVRYQL